MSKTDGDMREQLGRAGRSRSQGTTPPRPEQNTWIRRSLGVKIPEGSDTGPKPGGDDRGLHQDAMDEYTRIKARVDTQLTPLPCTLNPPFGVFKIYIDKQAALRTANDECLSKMSTASGKDAEALVKAVGDKLPDLETTHKAVTDKKAVMDKFALVSSDVSKAKQTLRNVSGELKTKLGIGTAADELTAASDEYNRKAGSATAAEQQTLLDTLNSKYPAGAAAVEKVEKFQPHEAGIAKAVEVVKALPDCGGDARTAVKLLDDAIKAFDARVKTATASETETLAKNVTDQLPLAQQAMSDGLTKSLGQGVSKKALRKQAMTYMKSDPTLLKALVNNDNGIDTLDKLVEDLKGKAEGADNEFMQAAIKARFGLTELKGDLSRKALPKLYAVLKEVPLSHTRDNEKLREVKRNKNWNPMSWYGTEANEEEGVGEFHMVLNGARSGGFLGWAQDIMFENHPEMKGKKLDKKRNMFTAATLHEVGHAVDEKKGFMVGAMNKGKEPQYGGWKVETTASVAQAGADALGFFADFTGKAYPKSFLLKYLEQVLQGKEQAAQAAAEADPKDFQNDPGITAAETERAKPNHDKLGAKALKKLNETVMKQCKLKGNEKLLAADMVGAILNGAKKDTAVTDVLAERATLEAGQGPPDWKKLSKHKAAEWCRSIKVKGGSGLWKKGTSGASKASPDGKRVYQEAYEGDWVSYDLASRAKALTNYQYRSHGEWYAEAYSIYFQRLLPKTHSLYAELEADEKPA